MPDASMDATLNALVAAGFGAAGQKCMALSTVVFVGSLSPWYCSLSPSQLVMYYFGLYLMRIFLSVTVLCQYRQKVSSCCFCDCVLSSKIILWEREGDSALVDLITWQLKSFIFADLMASESCNLVFLSNLIYLQTCRIQGCEVKLQFLHSRFH